MTDSRIAVFKYELSFVAFFPSISALLHLMQEIDSPSRILWAILDAHFLHFMQSTLINRVGLGLNAEKVQITRKKKKLVSDWPV